MCSAKIFFAIIFNEIKCHVNTSLGLVGVDASPSLCPRLATLPTVLYMYTCFTQKSVSGIASQLSFEGELHFISKNSSCKSSGRISSVGRTFHYDSMVSPKFGK